MNSFLSSNLSMWIGFWGYLKFCIEPTAAAHSVVIAQKYIFPRISCQDLSTQGRLLLNKSIGSMVRVQYFLFLL